jgi:hypothetical protein
MRRSNIISIIVGSLLVVGIIFFSAFLFPNSVTFRKFGFNEVSQLLTLLVLVSLFLERALEVFITTWRRPREEELDNEIQNNERVLAEKRELRDTKLEQPQTIVKTTETEVTRDPTKIKKEEAVQAIPEGTDKLTAEMNLELFKLKTNEQLRTSYKSQTRKIALWTALSVGLLISGVGVRSLNTLLEPVPQDFVNSNAQGLLFRCVDVLLTGGLIAGGSDGIHKITQLATTFFEETRNGIRDRAG